MNCEVCAYAEVHGCWPPGPLMSLRRVHCSVCHQEWGRRSQSCHCSVCHQTFPSVGAFDAHRVAERRAA